MLLESFLDGKDFEKSKDMMETINTCKAMPPSTNSTKKSGLLTVEQLCGVHKVPLHDDCSKSADVRTHWHDGPHFYPPHKKVENLFWSPIDHYNIHMQALDSVPTALQKVKYLFKCAS